MMSEVHDELDEIERWLRSLARFALLGVLRPGLSRSEIQARLVEACLEGNDELNELYGWRNGTDTVGAVLDELHLFPGFYLLSLDDAVANYAAFAADSRWDRWWLPVFANGGGDFYVVDLCPGVGGQVRHYRIDEQEHPMEFSSLSRMIGTLAAAYRRGVFFVDATGYLEMDDASFADLAAELSPDVAWWRSA